MLRGSCLAYSFFQRDILLRDVDNSFSRLGYIIRRSLKFFEFYRGMVNLIQLFVNGILREAILCSPALWEISVKSWKRAEYKSVLEHTSTLCENIFK